MKTNTRYNTDWVQCNGPELSKLRTPLGLPIKKKQIMGKNRTVKTENTTGSQR
ncbi:hypothetical protein Bca4012_076222 [Brassica carinata]